MLSNYSFKSFSSLNKVRGKVAMSTKVDVLRSFKPESYQQSPIKNLLLLEFKLNALMRLQNRCQIKSSSSSSSLFAKNPSARLIAYYEMRNILSVASSLEISQLIVIILGCVYPSFITQLLIQVPIFLLVFLLNTAILCNS